MIRECLINTKEKGVLVHSITNYVTVNDVANILLASGARPIMADDIEEVEEITSICNALYINIGTLNKRTIASMVAAGKKSNELGHPVLLDPVGVGASTLRTETTRTILEEVSIDILRGNLSEIKAIAMGIGHQGGVDAAAGDIMEGDSLQEAIQISRTLSEKLDALIIITGIQDVVTYKERSYIIKNGHAKMGQVTGTGCQLSALLCAYVASNPETPLEAAVTAVCHMGYAGEVAYAKLGEGEGNSTYRNRLIDAIDTITSEELEKGAKYELV